MELIKQQRTNTLHKKQKVTEPSLCVGKGEPLLDTAMQGENMPWG